MTILKKIKIWCGLSKMLFNKLSKVNKHMNPENPIVLDTGGIGAEKVDMNHAGCACTLVCYCEDVNSRPLRIIIKFTLVTAYRFSDEMHCGGFLADSYDSILEVKNSSWLKSICANEPSGHKELWRKRHFAMFIRSCGYYEFIADDVIVKNEYDRPDIADLSDSAR